MVRSRSIEESMCSAVLFEAPSPSPAVLISLLKQLASIHAECPHIVKRLFPGHMLRQSRRLLYSLHGGMYCTSPLGRHDFAAHWAYHS